MSPVLRLVAGLLLAGLCPSPAGEPDGAARDAIQKWLAFQRGVRTVEADFIQSRELRTVKNALHSTGTVWIDRRTEQFRWQTGDAANPKSVAVKKGNSLVLLQPTRKRAERLSLSSSAAGRGGPEAAFDFATGELPDTYEGLIRQFSILDMKQAGDAWRLRLAPSDDRLREALDEIVFLIDARNHHLRGFEMTFRDRSIIRTTFTRQKFNSPIDPTLFQPDLTGYQVKE